MGTSGCSERSTGSLIGCAAIELRLSMPWSSTAIVSRGVETRWEPIGVWLRGPLARGITGGLGDGVGAALGIVMPDGTTGIARPASARMRGVITGVGAVENEGECGA